MPRDAAFRETHGRGDRQSLSRSSSITFRERPSWK
jgi:hypothetical protein